jgi:hypothetical protein
MSYFVKNLMDGFTLIQLQNQAKKLGLSSVGSKLIIASRIEKKWKTPRSPRRPSPTPASTVDSRTANLVSGLTLAELKNMAKKYGIETSGTKLVIARRLAMYKY